ncbi:MAG: hypothetical protein ACRDYB_03995 [Acidimicrobiales bacterium]
MRSEGLAAYREMRRVRRARLLGDNAARFDRFYHGYLIVFFVAFATAYLASLLHETRSTPAQLADVRSYGPGAIGLLFVVAVALGTRSGVRGGPLVVDAPDVRYILSAPLSRRWVLTPLAFRKMASWMVLGALCGTAAGVLASLRLPGTRGAWIGYGLLFGLVVGGATSGAATVVSGLRLARWPVTLAALGGVTWGCVALATGRSLAQFGWLGQLALIPFLRDPSGLLLVAPVMAIVALGLLSAPGFSIEAAERRAGLAARVKFGLATRDFRTVIVLSKLLAQERSRRRPWIAFRPGSGRRFAVWKRDIEGLARWPSTRLLRLVALAVLAGLAARAAWGGFVWAIPLGGVVLWLIGVEVSTALAVEAETRIWARSFPVPDSILMRRHFPLAFAMGITCGIVAVGGASLVGSNSDLVVTALALVVPAVVAAIGGGVITNLRDAPLELQSASPELLGLSLVSDAIPLAIASCGLLPVFELGITYRDGASLTVGALWWIAVPLALGATAGLWAVKKGFP